MQVESGAIEIPADDDNELCLQRCDPNTRRHSKQISNSRQSRGEVHQRLAPAQRNARCVVLDQEFEAQHITARLLSVVDVHLPTVFFRDVGEEVEVADALLPANRDLSAVGSRDVSCDCHQHRQRATDRIEIRNEKIGRTHDCRHSRIRNREVSNRGNADAKRAILLAVCQPLQKILSCNSDRGHRAVGK